ncbi:MAG TPA: isopeptide-forming domain-containing fimbrial protein, partial [Pyrinomonadaceae bacterium]|nr:isopeptide-forming domain-containing fimbrial protein [Pyrinomonadaceae bacterium]
GGGGFVAHTGGAGVNVSGGAHGVTTTSLSTYGSADGAGGQILAVTAAQVPGVSSGAQCVPALTVTKTTTTATVNNGASGTTASYSILVSNAANRSAATQLSVSDTLPAGFTYASTTSVTFTGGATRPSTTNPAAGAAVPAWSQFTVPGGASVRVTFAVAVAAGTSGTHQNPAAAVYLDPARAVPAGTATAGYDPASSAGEDVTVVGPPSLQLVKSCTSPANCESQRQTPGTELTYTITFTNTGGRAATGITLYDIIPFSVDGANSLIVRSTEFKVGSMSFAPGTTGLTLAAGNARHYSDAIPFPAPAPPWSPSAAYAPGGAPGTFDPNVTYVSWTLTGSMPAGTSGSVSFTVRIR